MIPNNTSPLRITAAAGTKLAGASSAVNVIIFTAERALQPEGLHHSRGMAGSDLSSIVQYSLLLPPVGVWGRISVPVWLSILSDQLPIVGLVGFYPTNYLIGRRPFLWRDNALSPLGDIQY